MKLFYETLAPYWSLLSPLEDYEPEARSLLRVLEAQAPSARTLLELGSGGGHVAYHLRGRYELTLTDLSDGMLAQSRKLLPDVPHLPGDMRTLDLDRRFDLVLAHDAIDYMLTEADLARVAATAYRHLHPGGLFVCLPDHTRERFEPGTDCGGTDGDDGRAIRFLEWTPAPPDDATTGITHYAFVVRDADGTIHHVHEAHHFGLFAEATWCTVLEHAGFRVRVIDEPLEDEDRPPRRLFLAHKPRET